MHISSALFDRSAPDLESCPDESLPEFAFIGRSNVGKSSLLNSLSGKSELAKVSPVPGHTKLINHFTINKTWRLVDLPGYGYAKVARADKSKFNAAVTEYLDKRANLCLVFALIDSGLEPQGIDIEFVEWMVAHEVPFVLVFTKIDRFSTKVVKENIAAFNERIAKWFVQGPMVFQCSAKTGDGRSELLGVVEENLAAIKAEAKPGAHAVEREPAPKVQPLHIRKSRPW